jgi:glyoxylase-like metal-dependent hydrolase (beta-lactamase superfamily II)
MPDAWTITGIVDVRMRLHADRLYPEWDVAATDLALTVGAFLLRRDDRVVLVDAGAGETFTLPHELGVVDACGLLPDGLAAAGVTPEQVDDVVLSHLHHDHVGWAPLFGRATFCCHEQESGDDSRVETAIAPAAARIRRWADDGLLQPGLWLWHTPGHTPGSACLVVDGPVRPTVLVGDVVHHPVEFTAAFTGSGDADPARARSTRRAVVERARAIGAVVRGPHFPDLEADFMVEST